MQNHLGDDAILLVEGELTGERRMRAEAHLRECVQCADEVRLLRSTHARLNRAWPLEHVFPDLVKKRLAARLQERRTREPGGLRNAVVAAALLLAAGTGGFLLGRRNAPGRADAEDPRPAFALLLEEPEWPPQRPLARAGYAEWSRDLIAAGRSTGQGRKLTDESGWRVHRDGSVARPELGPCAINYSGWYLIRAANYDEAIDWVRRGPHLRFGSVLVRQLE